MSGLLATKFIIGAGVGIPASTLCINRRLYAITTVRSVSTSREDVSELRILRSTCSDYVVRNAERSSLTSASRLASLF